MKFFFYWSSHSLLQPLISTASISFQGERTDKWRKELRTVSRVGFVRTVFIGYCDQHLVTRIQDIVTIFPIPRANFSIVASLPCDYLLVNLLDIVVCDSFALVRRQSQYQIKTVKTQKDIQHILHTFLANLYDWYQYLKYSLYLTL